ncbi:DnaT-like ssDNA-binding domain-containing protein [Pseudomonas sp. SO81]|uniref:DnaT-like ssDNA-binding domain-containing protein n=1 Tax=Pseudomonas sp. SO81 TaxID=2983246 RepID=UPI0025A43BF0|nr:DnaT-like ssDNA-binding domain-containing protein [Pseudomonas sp. SO81]WJN60914.1 hypothetical protein OH686_19390 [Pseudomonas sp. SO81]
MAGDWIKMRVSLADDPAVILIADRLGLDEFSVVGRLQHLWSWADSQSRDGHAAGVTQKWIDRYLRCDGFAGVMAEAGWLVISEQGITFPNFERHNGATAKARGLAANRQQKKRGAVTPSVTPESPEPSRSERDSSVTREEKRRDKEQQQGEPPEDARQRFVMVETWKPDEVSLATHLKMIGVAAEQVTDEVVAEFVSYWLTRPETANNQGGWCRELVTSIKRAAARTAAKPAQAARNGRTSQHTDLKSQNLRDGLEPNPDGTYSF